MGESDESENKPQRDEKGRLLPGNTANPEGHTWGKGWQPYGQRCQYWLGKLSLEELQKLSGDKKALAKLSSYDAIIVKHLCNCLTGKDVGFERDRLLDRIEGKAKNRTELSGPNGGAIPVGTMDPADATKRVFEMLGQLAAGKHGSSVQTPAMDSGSPAGPDNAAG